MPKLLYLDPRPTRQAAAKPISHAVNIPLGQLEDRSHELPSKSETVLVVGPRELAEAAVAWLQRGGRDARIEPGWGFGPSTPGRLWRPSEFLESNLLSLKGGYALDLGCGSGRDAVALACTGWRVAASDNLVDALERADLLRQSYAPGGQVQWIQANLEANLPFRPGSFDLITMFRFLPRETLPEIAALLRPGGCLLLETFTLAHCEKFGKPSNPRRLLGPTEALSLFPDLRTVQHSYAWRSNGTHTARLKAVRV